MAQTLSVAPDNELLTSIDYSSRGVAVDGVAFDGPADRDDNGFPPSCEDLAQSFMEQAFRLVHLAEDWDSYGGRPPEIHSVVLAEALLRYLCWESSPCGSQRPIYRSLHLRPLAAGGVQLELVGPNLELEIEISAERVISFLLESKQGEMEGGEGELLELVKRIRSDLVFNSTMT